MLTAAVFMASPNRKQCTCPLTIDWLDEWGRMGGHSRGILCSREKEPTAATHTTDESQEHDAEGKGQYAKY